MFTSLGSVGAITSTAFGSPCSAEEAEADPLAPDTTITAMNDTDVVEPIVVDESPALEDTAGTIATTNMTVTTPQASSAGAVTASSVIMGVMAAVVAVVL